MTPKHQIRTLARFMTLILVFAFIITAALVAVVPSQNYARRDMYVGLEAAAKVQKDYAGDEAYTALVRSSQQVADNSGSEVARDLLVLAVVTGVLLVPCAFVVWRSQVEMAIEERHQEMLEAIGEKKSAPAFGPRH